MVGCMICSSLAVAPAFLVARGAEFVDLDGPLWLQADHGGGVRSHNGALQPAVPGFWGHAGGAIDEGAAVGARRRSQAATTRRTTPPCPWGIHMMESNTVQPDSYVGHAIISGSAMVSLTHDTGGYSPPPHVPRRRDIARRV